MSWNKWLLPLMCAVMCLMNVGQLVMKLSQPDHGSLLGQGLMALFWLGLAVLSFRGFTGHPEGNKNKEREENREREDG